jgi:hypothetical protein
MSNTSIPWQEELKIKAVTAEGAAKRLHTAARKCNDQGDFAQRDKLMREVEHYLDQAIEAMKRLNAEKEQ